MANKPRSIILEAAALVFIGRIKARQNHFLFTFIPIALIPWPLGLSFLSLSPPSPLFSFSSTLTHSRIHKPVDQCIYVWIVFLRVFLRVF